MGHASLFGYAGGSALAVLLATAAMHFPLVTTPRPMWFFRWLAGVGTAIAVLLPLGLTQELSARLATATVNLILGLTIIGLVRSTAAASLRSAAYRSSAGRGMMSPRGRQGTDGLAAGGGQGIYSARQPTRIMRAPLNTPTHLGNRKQAVVSSSVPT